MSLFERGHHMRTRTKLGVTIVVALAVAAIVPGPARAGIAGTPIPNPVDVIGGGLGDLAGGALGDLVPQLIHAVIKTVFGGVTGKLGLAIVKWLVSHPDLTSAKYHELAQLRGYVSDAATGILTLVLVASAMRFWVSGYTSTGASEGAQALARAALAAALLVAYPYFIADALRGANLFTAALLSSHGVVSGTQHMFDTALALQIAGGPAGAGLGLIAAVISFVILILLIVSKIVLATLLAILYVLAPLAIALWPLPETSWVGRVFVQGLLAVIVWPPRSMSRSSCRGSSPTKRRPSACCPASATPPGPCRRYATWSAHVAGPPAPPARRPALSAAGQQAAGPRGVRPPRRR
jgi:hypothetical protein